MSQNNDFGSGDDGDGCDADSGAMIAEHINVFGAHISSRDAFAETIISDENSNASETDSVFYERCTWIRSEIQD